MEPVEQRELHGELADGVIGPLSELGGDFLTIIVKKAKAIGVDDESDVVAEAGALRDDVGQTLPIGGGIRHIYEGFHNYGNIRAGGVRGWVEMVEGK